MRDRNLLVVLLMNLLAACGGGSSDSGSADTLVGKQTTYAIGGTLRLVDPAPDQTALEVTLVNRLGGKSMTLRTTGPFTFDSLANGTSYEIHVPSNPVGFSCEVHNGNGRMDTAPKNDIDVVCTAGAYSVRGMVTGLGVGNPGLQIGNNSQAVSIDSDGPFSFSVRNGVGYRIHLATLHGHYFCELRNSAGAVVTEIAGTINAADVSGINVMCAAPIRVHVTGLEPITPSIQLTNTYSVPGQADDVENLFVDRAGDFSFSTPLPSGRAFRINVAVQHPDYACIVPTTQTTVGALPVVVNVTCIEHVYTMGGSVSGLSASSIGLSLLLVSGAHTPEEISVQPVNDGGSRPFIFQTQLPTNASYTFMIANEPEDRVCQFSPVNSGSGTVNRQPVNISVECSAPPTLSITGASASGNLLAPNQTNVPLAAAISILFSTSINAATINGTSVLLTSPHGTQPASLEIAGNSVHVRPNGKLIPSTVYSIQVGLGVRGTGKERLTSTFAQSFTTGTGWGTATTVGTVPGASVGRAAAQQIGFDQFGNAVALWSWGTNVFYPTDNAAFFKFDAMSKTWGAGQQFISTTYSGPLSGFNCQFGLDDEGNAIAAWSQHDDNGEYSVYANYLPAIASLWTPRQTVESSLGNAVQIQIQSDLQGNAIAVWRQGDVGVGMFYANRYDGASHTWGTPVLLAQVDNLTLYSGFSFDMDASGNALFVWSDADNNTVHMRARKFDADDERWLEADTLSENVTAMSAPRIVMNRTGEGFVIWSQSEDGGYSLYAKTMSLTMTSYGPNQRLHFFSDGAALPFVPVVAAINEIGRALIAFQAKNASGSTVYLTTFGSVGGSFESPQSIVENPIPDGSTLRQVVVDGKGTGSLLWMNSNGSNAALYFARRSTRGSWSASQTLDNRQSAAGLTPIMAVDPFDNVMVTWARQDAPTQVSIIAARYAENAGVWSPNQVIGEHTGFGVLPKMAFDRYGNALVIWGVNASFYANRFE